MSERLKSFREMKRSMKVGRYFEFSKRKLSGSAKFKKKGNLSSQLKKTGNLKFWRSNRSQSSDNEKNIKSAKKKFKTPFSPSRRLQVVSARKVTFQKKFLKKF